MFYGVSVPRYSEFQQAQGGVLDLTGEDFSRGLFALDGEWEFYFGRMYTPADFSGGSPAGLSFITVPLSWHEAGYPVHGFATYRLVLKTEEPSVMMLIPEIQSSSVIWVNGQRVFDAGRPGTGVSDTEPGLRNAFVTGYPVNGQVEIVIQVANFAWYSSGIVYSIDAARSDVLLRDALLRRVLLGVTIGVLLAIAFYHIILYLYNRREQVYLVFFLFCIVASLRFFVDVNGFASLLLPGGIAAGLVYLYSVFLALQVLLLTVFTHLVFNLPIGKVRWAIYITALLLPSVISLALPYGVVNYQIGYIAILPKIMVFINVFRSRRYLINPLYGLYIVALGWFCFWFPFSQIVLRNMFYMHGVVTNLFIVFSQCFVLSVNYVETKLREKELSRRTDFYRVMSHNLRTPLTVISTNIQTARRRPEEASMLLEDSQGVLMEMADTIESALEDDDKGFSNGKSRS